MLFASTANYVETEATNHILEDIGRANMRRCTICYANMSREFG